MNNLEKIVLLNWYADENIDFVLKKNQKIYAQEERAGLDYDKIHKKNDLYDIKTVQGLIEYIDECDISDLKIYSKNTHIHQGSLNPEILIVNDFPNSEEEDWSNNILDEDCKELLVKMLRAINVELKENTIINTFFWRTPGDRRPTSNEIDKCRPFFYKIIELLKPKYIISLGDLALSVLMESEVNFIDSRGKTFNNKKMNIPIFPLFHPRVLIKQPSLKRLAWEDLKIIANEIK
ncbi:MAG: uracil-DNA glycosylase [Pseudomonadota bacterium]|nr:uracil-DNA glycosylase [Pseudomonadota bacterium]